MAMYRHAQTISVRHHTDKQSFTNQRVAYATAVANGASGTLHEAAYGGCGYIRGG